MKFQTNRYLTIQAKQYKTYLLDFRDSPKHSLPLSCYYNLYKNALITKEVRTRQLLLTTKVYYRFDYQLFRSLYISISIVKIQIFRSLQPGTLIGFFNTSDKNIIRIAHLCIDEVALFRWPLSKSGHHFAL